MTRCPPGQTSAMSQDKPGTSLSLSPAGGQVWSRCKSTTQTWSRTSARRKGTRWCPGCRRQWGGWEGPRPSGLTSPTPGGPSARWTAAAALGCCTAPRRGSRRPGGTVGCRPPQHRQLLHWQGLSVIGYLMRPDSTSAYFFLSCQLSSWSVHSATHKITRESLGLSVFISTVIKPEYSRCRLLMYVDVNQLLDGQTHSYIYSVGNL